MSVKVDYEKLCEFVEKILIKTGLDEFSAESVKTGLCETSLRGVDSHGARLLPHYVNSAKTGRKNPKPNFKLNKTFPCMGNLDADNAYGHSAGMKAIDEAMKMAEEFGVGVVGVSNSSHPGAMASFALRAARKGYMAFAFTHADSLMKSHNSTQAYFGTNPVCFAAPRKGEEPFCLDMATTMIPWNKVLLHRSKKMEVDDGLAAGPDGKQVNDPNAATCLFPAGHYKGFGLAAMVEILCGVFTGMAFGHDIPSMYKAPMDQTRKLGQFYMVLRVDGCIDSEVFMNRMSEMSNQVRNEPAMEGEKVQIAGDPEIDTAAARLKEGVPLDPTTVELFFELGKENDVDTSFLNN